MATKTIKIDKFNGGISDSVREFKNGIAGNISNFDIYTDPNLLIPSLDNSYSFIGKSGGGDITEYLVRNSIYATDSYVYGLGITSNSYPKILKTTKNGTEWTLPANAEGTAGSAKYNCLVEYKNYLWGFLGSNVVWKYGDLTSSPTFTNSVGTVGATISTYAQGLVAKDDILYLPYNNIIASISSAGALTDEVLTTIPTKYKIMALENYGNYVAIACSPKNTGNDKSIVYLWIPGEEDITEIFDAGDGEIRVMKNLGGILTIVSVADGIDTDTLIIKQLKGSVFEKIKEVSTVGTIGITPISYTKDDKIYFSMDSRNAVNGSLSNGIWCFGRKSPEYPYALSCQYTISTTMGETLYNFSIWNDIVAVFHSTGAIARSLYTGAYSTTIPSIYESQIFSGEKLDNNKSLISVSVETKAMPTAGQIILKYKTNTLVDNVSASWTTLFTNTTNNSFGYTMPVNISFNEIKFRIESTGGAVVKSFKFKYEENEGNI